jgi:hypothetical protein
MTKERPRFVSRHSRIRISFVVRHSCFVIPFKIFRPQQAKSKLLFPRRRIKGDGNVDETETDAAFPNCAHTQLFRTASRICADEDADLIWGAHAPRVLIAAPSPQSSSKSSRSRGAIASTRGRVRSPEIA